MLARRVCFLTLASALWASPTSLSAQDAGPPDALDLHDPLDAGAASAIDAAADSDRAADTDAAADTGAAADTDAAPDPDAPADPDAAADPDGATEDDPPRRRRRVRAEDVAAGEVTETLPALPEPLMPRLTFDPKWGKSGLLNYLMIGTSVVISGLNMGIGPREDNPTQGGILFDEGTRDALRMGDEFGRVIVRDISDVFLTILTSYPSVVDGLLVAAWMHDSAEVAVQLILMHAEVVTFLLAMQTTANVIMSRERPYGRTCGGPTEDDLPADSGLCDSPGRYYSWFSGHASQSFANAALICMNHAYLPLYGGGAADLAPCLVGLAMAGATAVLRIAGDMHYASDVITGAVVGSGVGVLLPWLLHYGHDDAPLTIENEDVSVTVLPTPNGATVFGSF